MEMFVLKTVNWKIDPSTISERVSSLIARYGCSGYDDAARIKSLKKFSGIINDFAKSSLLLTSCCTGNYQQLSLAVMYSIFDIFRAENQRIHFTREIQDLENPSWVGVLKFQDCIEFYRSLLVSNMLLFLPEDYSQREIRNQLQINLRQLLDTQMASPCSDLFTMKGLAKSLSQQIAISSTQETAASPQDLVRERDVELTPVKCKKFALKLSAMQTTRSRDTNPKHALDCSGSIRPPNAKSETKRKLQQKIIQGKQVPPKLELLEETIMSDF